MQKKQKQRNGNVGRVVHHKLVVAENWESLEYSGLLKVRMRAYKQDTSCSILCELE